MPGTGTSSDDGCPETTPSRAPSDADSACHEVGTEAARGLPILARLTDLPSPLHELFGFDAFRQGQEDVVRAAIAGRDTLALMPTGSGKSLTYQLAAMLRPEPTLVLSPLIALMKDQVDKLPPAIAATATFVNSSLSAEETAERLAGVEAGDDAARLRGAGTTPPGALRRASLRGSGSGSSSWTRCTA